MSAGWLGGAGGAERALYSVLRALEPDDVDVVVRQRLAGPYSETQPGVRVYSLANWRWRGSARTTGAKGALIQRLLNPIRRAVDQPHDVSIQFLHGGRINAAARTGVRLLIPSGSMVSSDTAKHYDAIALQAPDNVHLAPRDHPTVLLPPPVFHLSDAVGPLSEGLPSRFYLTVFNPHHPVKGVEDLLRAADSAPHPIVWCHSKQTMEWQMPRELEGHPGIVHVESPTPAQLRGLYERCLAYLSFSRSEGFGWSTADALRYTGIVVSRPVGVLSFPQARQEGVIIVGKSWDVNWLMLPSEPVVPTRDLGWLSPVQFRDRVAEIAQHGWPLARRGT